MNQKTKETKQTKAIIDYNIDDILEMDKQRKKKLIEQRQIMFSSLLYRKRIRDLYLLYGGYTR